MADQPGGVDRGVPDVPPSPLTLDRVVEILDRRYPPASAEPWDAVGVVCGDPEQPVFRVLFAVDPVPAVVDEAVSAGVDLVITHHPLFLTPVHGIAVGTPAGEVVHRLIRAGIGLVAVHTNADVARPGVSDALADLLGIRDTVPLAPGDIDAAPDHPATGLGRIGRLDEPTSLGQFADVVAARLPATAHGVRILGDRDRRVEVVAVCGGSGDSLLAAATAAGADAYVTSDLKHHRALDHVLGGGCAVLDVAHWAGEWPWLPVAAGLLQADIAEQGATVECLVSTISTDPWTDHREASVEV